MPIYQYACESCGLNKNFQHAYDEKLKVCPACGATEGFKKVLSNFNMSKKVETKNRVGDLTKEYIEENRKILEDHKKELRKEKV